MQESLFTDKGCAAVKKLLKSLRHWHWHLDSGIQHQAHALKTCRQSWQLVLNQRIYG